MATICNVPEEKALDIKNLEFTYASADEPSLKQISMPIAKNSITALIGPSGCGKSTTGRAILQLYRPTSGEVLFEGTELTPSEPLIDVLPWDPMSWPLEQHEALLALLLGIEPVEDNEQTD